MKNKKLVIILSLFGAVFSASQAAKPGIFTDSLGRISYETILNFEEKRNKATNRKHKIPTVNFYNRRNKKTNDEIYREVERLFNTNFLQSFRGKRWQQEAGIRLQKTKSADEILIPIKNELWRILLPYDFFILEDDIKSEGGQLVAKNKVQMYVLRADKRDDYCVKFDYYKERCLKQQIKKIYSEILSANPGAVRTKKRTGLLTLDKDIYKLNIPNHELRYIYQSFEHKGRSWEHLAFYRYNTNRLWQVVITSKDKNQKFGLQQILRSITTLLPEYDIPYRPQDIDLAKQIAFTKIKQHQGKENYPKLTNNAAKKIPFYIGIPPTLRKVQDNITYNEGSMNFRGKFDEEILVVATNNRCSYYSTNNIPECLSKASRDYETVWTIRQKNAFRHAEMRFMTKSQLTLLPEWKNAGRFDIAQIAYFNNLLVYPNQRRYAHIPLQSLYDKAIITFREPNFGYIWYIAISTPKQGETILSSSNYKRRFLNSIEFDSNPN